MRTSVARRHAVAVVALVACAAVACTTSADPPGTGAASDAHATSSPAPTPPYITRRDVTLRGSWTELSREIRRIPSGTRLAPSCAVQGERVVVDGRTDDRWDRVTYDGWEGYVSNVYVDSADSRSLPADLPLC